ncbi:FG-GAP-like repeat-containing protein [Marininema halotolerans]|uniref:Repeat domain-containing protein n=1 Tax=Marininema halotolerans TaxID=1155944 RepID=A0A1I6QJX0_9BACL|nr:FG-GAP-like repeat-containing protein [Marininema halotolerans]SFS52759.1 Repeat domain-containing protein [Marininema halotolerans]
MVCPAYTTQTTFDVGGNPIGITTGDFNSDGNLDLAVVNVSSATVSVLLGDGTGSFATQATFTVGNTPIQITTGDFNNDGDLDLAVTNYSTTTISLLLGNGDGSFATQTTFTVEANPYGITAGDFNNDGNLDLAVANNGFNGGTTVSVLLGNGAGSFGTQTTFTVETGPEGITTGDFNNDGNLDLAVTNFSSGTVSVLLGNGAGSFGTQSTFDVGDAPEGITVGDFNNDGNLDLAVINNNNNTVSILLGNGDGSFATQSTFDVGIEPTRITTGDFNCDGNLDLAVTNLGVENSGTTISVLLGNGDGSFATQTTFTVGTGPDGITTGDFNNDGSLDLAISDSGDATVSILLNSCVNPLTCSDLTLENDPGTCEATVPDPTTAQCPNVITVCNPDTVQVDSPTSVTCTATSNVNPTNTEACTFTVTVIDTEPPVLSGLNDIEIEANNNIGTIVTYVDPTATDNCPGTITITCSPLSGSFFPVGSTTVTCTASDSNGNASTGSFIVTVIPFQEE